MKSKFWSLTGIEAIVVKSFIWKDGLSFSLVISSCFWWISSIFFELPFANTTSSEASSKLFEDASSFWVKLATVSTPTLLKWWLWSSSKKSWSTGELFWRIQTFSVFSKSSSVLTKVVGDNDNSNLDETFLTSSSSSSSALFKDRIVVKLLFSNVGLMLSVWVWLLLKTSLESSFFGGMFIWSLSWDAIWYDSGWEFESFACWTGFSLINKGGFCWNERWKVFLLTFSLSCFIVISVIVVIKLCSNWGRFWSEFASQDCESLNDKRGLESSLCVCAVFFPLFAFFLWSFSLLSSVSTQKVPLVNNMATLSNRLTGKSSFVVWTEISLRSFVICSLRDFILGLNFTSFCVCFIFFLRGILSLSSLLIKKPSFLLIERIFCWLPLSSSVSVSWSTRFVGEFCTLLSDGFFVLTLLFASLDLNDSEATTWLCSRSFWIEVFSYATDWDNSFLLSNGFSVIFKLSSTWFEVRDNELLCFNGVFSSPFLIALVVGSLNSKWGKSFSSFSGIELIVLNSPLSIVNDSLTTNLELLFGVLIFPDWMTTSFGMSAVKISLLISSFVGETEEKLDMTFISPGSKECFAFICLLECEPLDFALVKLVDCGSLVEKWGISFLFGVTKLSLFCSSFSLSIESSSSSSSSSSTFGRDPTFLSNSLFCSCVNFSSNLIETIVKISLSSIFILEMSWSSSSSSWSSSSSIRINSCFRSSKSSSFSGSDSNDLASFSMTWGGLTFWRFEIVDGSLVVNDGTSLGCLFFFTFSELCLSLLDSVSFSSFSTVTCSESANEWSFWLSLSWE